MKLADSTSCTACMACVDICNYQALKKLVDSNGFYSIAANQDQCVECGMCSQICPVLNPSVVNKDEMALSKPYAAWCTDDVLRTKCASGGAFASIAKLFLENGAVVYGAAINGFEIHHIRVDRLNDLPMILGSKYQHSRMDGIYRQIKKDLCDGRTVLYSGLSCQVAGILNYISKKWQSHLFTIDTICGGLSTMLPMLKLQSTNIYTGIHSFRNKDNGWKSSGYKYDLKMYQSNGEVADLGMDNMVLRCFCHKETKRPSCLDCRFNGFHRNSDVTIGDFWGDTRFADQHHDGLSVLITHSKRMLDILENSPLHMEPITWPELLGSNPNVYWSSRPYLLKSLTRKRVFRKLRKGNDRSATRVLEKSLLKRVELFIYQRENERKRKEYLNKSLNKQEES